MKKVLFVFALVAMFGVSMAMSSADMVAVDDAMITIVDVDKNDVTPEGEKEGEKAATPAKGKAKAEGCSGTKVKAEAKADGCSGAKTTTAEAKKDCSSTCSDKKTTTAQK